MRQLVLSLCLILTGTLLSAFEIEDRARFGPDGAGTVLTILSTTDTEFFAPLITGFLDGREGVAVDYTVASSAEVVRAIRDEGARFDVVVSSAMDLQTKLANDGLAQRHRPDTAADLPDWAIWNDMVFAFTEEPAAIVLSRAAWGDLPLPSTRQELISILRENADRFRGRIGTYDVRTSGLGYLFATQDARSSDTYWRLTEVMGALDARLYCCSSDMLDDVISGDLALAYNVLGSYAASRSDGAADVVLILPTDFTTIMQRSILIPRTAERPDLARAFTDYVLGAAFGGETPLGRPESLSATGESSLRRIRLGPGLLVYLDRFKRESFLAEWESAMLQ